MGRLIPGHRGATKRAGLGYQGTDAKALRSRLSYRDASAEIKDEDEEARPGPAKVLDGGRRR